MITIEQAFEKLMAKTTALSSELIPTAKANGRVLATPLPARRTQPAANLSAMDGYAVRSQDLTGAPIELTLIGEVGAGDNAPITVGPGQAARIFTGGVVPEGADQVVMQENTNPTEGRIALAEPPKPFGNIRAKGSDFAASHNVMEAGQIITPKAIGLIAAAGYGQVMVHRAPKVTILATGNEIVPADKPQFEVYETVDSASPMIAALLEETGANIIKIQHIGDSAAAITNAMKQARETSDLVISIGGASVGDRDYVREALTDAGFEQDFWKISMRPGKPLIAGHSSDCQFIGLPGNAISAFVCSFILVRSMIDKMLGRPTPFPAGIPVRTASEISKGGPRTHYMRARLTRDENGLPLIDVAMQQDSSLVSVLAACDGLVVRPIDCPATPKGEKALFLPF